MIHRQTYLYRIHMQFQIHKVCGLLGPRQSGKTTLAREFVTLHNIPRSRYFDLENPLDLDRLKNPVLAFENFQGYVVIDEIQRRPDLFATLRYIVDSFPLKFLILGSASRDLIQQSSETLAGRIGYVDVHPLSMGETDNVHQLWQRGGFPLSYLADSDALSFEWRSQYIKTLLERDLLDLGFRVPPAQLRRFWMMLAHYHGQILNASEIGQALGVSYHTIQHYLSILEGTFMVRLLQPWHENLKKRQVKRPKVYFRDSGIYHALLGLRMPDDLYLYPKIGTSWEGFALEEITRLMNVSYEDCYFWSTHNVAEIDLLVVKDGKRVGIDFKYADHPTVPKTLPIIMDDLKLDEVKLVYPGREKYAINANVEAVGLQGMAHKAI